jgi:heme exporter protein D
MKSVETLRMDRFLAMGGFAMYVWPAYAAFFIILAGDVLATVVRRRRVLRELRGRLARQGTRRRPRASA